MGMDAVFFALEVESGCLEDRLSGMKVFQADRFSVRQGMLGDREILVIRTGVRTENVRRAAQAVRDAYPLERVFSAGFAGALTSGWKRGTVFFPAEVCDEAMHLERLEVPDPLPNGTKVGGRLLTCSDVLGTVAEKRAAAERYDAEAVDMETFALAEACREWGLPFCAVRGISDEGNQEISPDIQQLSEQTTWMAQLGAACRVAWKRPASIREMLHLREGALVTALNLAETLSALISPGAPEPKEIL